MRWLIYTANSSSEAPEPGRPEGGCRERREPRGALAGNRVANGGPGGAFCPRYSCWNLPAHLAAGPNHEVRGGGGATLHALPFPGALIELKEKQRSERTMREHNTKAERAQYTHTHTHTQ